VKLNFVSLRQLVSRTLGHLRVLGVIVLVSVLLSGCVNYDLGVRFDGEHHGKIVQQIKLGEKLTKLGDAEATEWLRSLESRAKQLQGKTQRLSDREIAIAIPFNNGKELVSKFEQFFNPVGHPEDPRLAAESDSNPSFNSNLRLDQNNFFVVQRNHLSYDLDLRSLGVINSDNGKVVVTTGSLFDLQFSLETPWGANSIEKSPNAIRPKIYDDGHQLVWTLQPGQINHIEVAFWLPSSLGIGMIIIILVVLGGFYVKYKSFPWERTDNNQPAIPSKVM